MTVATAMAVAVTVLRVAPWPWPPWPSRRVLAGGPELTTVGHGGHGSTHGRGHSTGRHDVTYQAVAVAEPWPSAPVTRLPSRAYAPICA